VKRNERGPFASAFVFPGGVVEKDDYSESWLPYLQSGEHATAEERALRIAACRETWEEVSILPGGAGDPVEKSMRPPSIFFEYVARGGIRLALNELVLFSHWITPLSVPKRFDTHFFICRTDSTHPGQCDGIETVDLEWIQPRHALASAERGDRSFLLPTHENLRLLADSTNADEAIETARSRTVLPIMPRRVVIGDTVTFTVIPASE